MPAIKGANVALLRWVHASTAVEICFLRVLVDLFAVVESVVIVNTALPVNGSKDGIWQGNMLKHLAKIGGDEFVSCENHKAREVIKDIGPPLALIIVALGLMVWFHCSGIRGKKENPLEIPASRNK